MSFLHFVTQAHHLPELELDPPALDAGRSADEADYTAEHAREAMAAEMAALRAAAPQPTPDPDGARLMMEYAADKLAAELSADESVSAFLDDSRDAFVDWLSTMGSDPHAARPGVARCAPTEDADEGPVYCHYCSGTGEGATPRSCCRSCRGTGTEPARRSA